METILVTGGCGFIGSNFVRHLLGRYPRYRVVVLDLLTYAGHRETLADLLAREPRLELVVGDIADAPLVDRLMARVDACCHFAAESHVDRSLHDATTFIHTNVEGTYVLLAAAARHRVARFVQVSTDEVYGEVLHGAAPESAPLRPRNPYSAAKAGADLLALACHQSFGVEVLVTRGSNTFGPYQHIEKLIPLATTNLIDDLPVPLYGDGSQVRDWLYVGDHCAAVDHVLHHGTPGEVYNIGGGQERRNREVVERIVELLGKPPGLIQPVADRPGHDRRYAVDCSKLLALGWRRGNDFETRLEETVRWYQANQAWWRPIKAASQEFLQRQYAQRLATRAAN